jgi:chemotaxis family two-component system sensor kinase Cph1
LGHHTTSSVNEMEEPPEDTNSLLKSILENSLDAAYRRNLRTDKYDYISPVVERLTGLSDEEMKNVDIHSMMQRLHPEDLPKVQEQIEKTLSACSEAGRTTGTLEYRFRCNDGKYRWLADYFTVIPDNNGQPLHLLGVVRDISEYKRIEESLRESEEAYKALSANLPGIVYRSFIKQKYMQFFNEMIETLSGFTETELSYGEVCSIEPLILAEDRQDVMAEVERAVAEKRPFAVSYRIRKKKGEIRYFQEYGKPIYGEDGEPLHIDGVIFDITERQRMEEELKRSNADLQQFAYVASHDLREPLRNINSYVKLLEKRLKQLSDEKTHEYIHYIVDGVKRMQDLISDLLDYSKIETEGKTLRTVNMSAALNKAISNLGSPIRESGAVVTNDELPSVKGDASQLVSLFQNLVGNAIKYRSEEVPHVHVSAERGEDEYVFSVRDNGIGIAPEFKEDIFLVFRRLHGRYEYSGTGIGLAICKRVVERHGGRIWVESEPGKGSTFYFSVPS